MSQTIAAKFVSFLEFAISHWHPHIEKERSVTCLPTLERK